MALRWASARRVVIAAWLSRLAARASFFALGFDLHLATHGDDAILLNVDQQDAKAEKNFGELKRSSKPVRDWAAQPLSDGLRGKAVSGNPDNDHKNRSA